MWLFLHLYWLMGGCALRRPSMMESPPLHRYPALRYQEAMLCESDSRFVIDRIRAFDSEHCMPLNHCRLVSADYDNARRCWRVDLRDELTGEEHSASARTIVNGAGVWTDEVNRLLGVESPYKHAFSKGVYLAFPKNEGQSEAHVYPMDDRDDVMTHVPWGPVMMWGPTETTVREIEEGLAPNRDDLRFLLAQANTALPWKVGAEDVVSVRCGIRPLAVPRNYSRDVYPLDLSRRHRVVVHGGGRSISLYGGKLTSSLKVADHVADMIGKRMVPRFPRMVSGCPRPERFTHPELGHEFVTADWARDHEFCVTLDDYLRRRTSIAQWTPRMGLGRNGCGRESLLNPAETFTQGPAEAAAMVQAYERNVRAIYDPLLEI
jgi:glycerol-3-phosphate dehydrogenase